jgi:hypothetical protein
MWNENVPLGHAPRHGSAAAHNAFSGTPQKSRAGVADECLGIAGKLNQERFAIDFAQLPASHLSNL